MRSNIRPLVQTFYKDINKVIRCQSSYTALPAKKFSTRHFEEIKIAVPWGELAGKWYGPKHVRPIVGLHGWQDNAGTFDTLAPLLPSHIPFLSLDLPGHGHSSWLPPGCCYHSIDYVLLMLRIMNDYKWDKISIIAHSMSAINSFVFASLFPTKVDMLVSLDVLKPLIRSAAKIVDAYADRLQSSLQVEQRIASDSEPPSYEWDQLAERLHIGTERSVSLEACKFLLQRNTKTSRHEPHKYYFSRDSRLKKSLFYAFPKEVPLEMAKRITCPHLFIKARQGPLYERKEYHEEALEIVKKNPLFEYHEVEGTHHVHLNEPDKVAPLINSFINKYRK